MNRRISLSLVLIVLVLMVQSIFAQKKELIDTDEKFTPGGKVEIKNYSSLPGVKDINRTETGVLNGIAYRFYYSDGSGTFVGDPRSSLKDLSYPSVNWYVECKKDAIDDRKYCAMQIRDLRIIIMADGKKWVTIGTNNYPHTPVAIRLDDDVFKGSSEVGFDTETSTKIIERLKTTKVATTRFQQWPYESNVDKTWNLFGFNETFQYINWALSKIK